MKRRQKLYESLQQRQRPEDIAELIRQTISSSLDNEEYKILDKAAQYALHRKNPYGAYTSMPQKFRSIVDASTQLNKANELFNFKNSQESDIGVVLLNIENSLQKKIGTNDFVKDRLNKNERKRLGLDLSKRQYNKRWRLAKRIEKKQNKIQKEEDKLEFEKISHHGLTHHILYEDFSKDINSACFIAYYNARCNLRSIFTNGSQERPFDEICEMLLKRCTKSSNWFAIAHTYLSVEILNQLTVQQKSVLLDKWTNILNTLANTLRELWEKNDINKETMIVKKGNDSSTWNHTAGAWNKARDHWLYLIHSLGLETKLNTMCFGKVLRLMAGDVVAWHYNSDNTLDPNTYVWNELPLPWEIFQKILHVHKIQ